ncbi:MAG: hypothetical protein MUP76_02560 [Acidimicrobiia bacterium]|nr:hypothetical protein [Acidimicrobiia bacterium]
MLLAAASDLITALDRYDTVAWDLGRQQEKHGPLSADELSVLTPHMDALDSLITRTRLIIGADPIGQWILDWTYTWVVEAYQSEETELHLKAIASEMGEAWQLKTVVEGQESILGQSPDPVRFPTVSTWIEKYRDAALREESGSIFWKGLPHRNQALAALRDFGHTYLVPWLESELAPPAKGAPKQ